MDALPTFMVVIFAVVIGGMLVLFPMAILTSRRAASRRRSGMAAFADQRGWAFRAEDRSLGDRFSGPPFGRGSGYATNVLLGEHDDRPFVAFDYQVTSIRSDTTQQHHYSVVAVGLGLTAPDLSVAPTTMVRRWVDGLTGGDIEIGDPVFDAHFTVHSPAPEFAVDLLLSDVREVLQHHGDVAWRISGDSLLVIRTGRHTPREIDAKLHMTSALLARVPDLVWERLRTS